MLEDNDLSGATESHLEINKVYRENVCAPEEAGRTQLCILTLRDSVRYYRDKYKLELTNTKQSGGAQHVHGTSYKHTEWEN